MKLLQHVFVLPWLLTAATAGEPKVEIGRLPEWQKPILGKVSFGVQMRSLSQIVDGRSEGAGRPSFLVFTAKAEENLGKRLLWMDCEVELSDGRKQTFKGVAFHLLREGTEADIRKLDGVDSILPGDDFFGEGQAKQKKPLEVLKLKIISAVCK